MVTVKESEETALGTGGTLDAAEAEVIAGAGNVPEIPQQFLDPKSRALANGRELRRLEVGKAEGGKILVLLGKRRQTVNHDCELGQQQRETLTEEDQVGVAVPTSGSVAENARERTR